MHSISPPGDKYSTKYQHKLSSKLFIFDWKNTLVEELISKKNSNFWEHTVFLCTQENQKIFVLVCPAGSDSTSMSTHTSAFHICRTWLNSTRSYNNCTKGGQANTSGPFPTCPNCQTSDADTIWSLALQCKFRACLSSSVSLIWRIERKASLNLPIATPV